MVLTAILVDLVFNGLDRLFPAVHFILAPTRHFVQTVTTFSLNYTAVLNIVTLVAIGVLIFLNVRYPMQMLMDHSMHDHHPMAEMGGDEDGMPRTAHEGRTMG